MRTRLLLVATSVVAAAALFTASLAVAGSTLHLTAKDNHKSFAVQRHSTVVITLASCGSCGYRWRRGPCTAVKLVEHGYVQPRGRIGGMGRETWRFRVVGRSESEVQLRYVSPARKIAKHFVVGLRVG